MSAEGRRESLRAFDHANKRSELPTLSGLTSEEEEEEEEKDARGWLGLLEISKNCCLNLDDEK